MAGMTFPPYMSPAAVNCGRLRSDIKGGYRVKIAFKEWAFICRALATGRQTLVLRKGGIREEGGEFRPDHPAFFLFPTYFHQASETITQEARSKLQEVMAEQPDSGILRLSHFAEISEAIRVYNLRGLLSLREIHVWSDEAVKERFHRWGENVLFALILRVYALPQTVDLPMRDEYAGCKSWVSLEEDVRTDGSTHILDKNEFSSWVQAIRVALNAH